MTYTWGIGLSYALAAVLLALTVMLGLLLMPNGVDSLDLAYLSFYLANGLALPLAVLLGLVWLGYMLHDKGRVPGRVHAHMLLPSLLILLIAALGYEAL